MKFRFEESAGFYGLLAFATTLALVALAKIPFSQPFGVALDFAQKIIRGESVADNTLAIGYPLFLALALKLGGLKTIFVGQALLYLGTVLLAYWILRFLAVGRTLRLVAAAVIAAHPYLLLDIKRIVSNNLSVFLTSAAVAYLVRYKKHPLRPFTALLWGALFGLMILDRPNMIFLSPLLLAAPFLYKKPLLKTIPSVAVLFAATVSTISLTNLVFREKAFVVDPYYGIYHFYSGANPYSYKYLLREYAADPSIVEASAAAGVPYILYGKRDPQVLKVYWDLGTKYVFEHPFRYLFLLVPLKVATMLRPDYRRITRSELAPPVVMFVIQNLLAMPAILWLITRWRLRKNLGFLVGPMAGPFAILWIIPFAFTHTELRLRTPLDIVLIIDTTFCWWSYRTAKKHAPRG